MKTACQNTFICLVVLCVLLIKAIGQPIFKVQYYSAEHGLSHQAVTSIIKDAEGFMWFGTWDGINRFDGHVFVPHKSFPGDNSILGNSRIDQIVEDQAGHFWIEAYDKHIYCFDKKTEEFLPLSPIIDTKGKPKTAFSRILLASNGLIWLQSEKDGIFCLSQIDFSTKPVLKYHKSSSADYKLPSDNISFFHKDSQHQIWVGTSDGLCILTKNASGEYKNKLKISSNIASGMSFTTVEEDASQLFFGTKSGELIIYNKKTTAFNVVKITNSQLNSLLRSKKGDFLYATTSLGEVINLNLTNLKRTVATYDSREPLYKIFEDHTGFLWIEPEKRGVILLNPKNNTFKLFASKSNEGLNYIGNRFECWKIIITYFG